MTKGNRERVRLGPGAGKRIWLPGKEREKNQVSRSVQNAANQCCLASIPWPLVLLGEAGSGKTCAALVLLDEVGGFYRTVAEWIEELADAMHDRLRSSSGHLISKGELRRVWATVNFAVLDELGAREQVTDHHCEAVKWALDVREGRPLTVISNLSLKELTLIYGDPVASRLSAGTLVTLTGDRRIGERTNG